MDSNPTTPASIGRFRIDALLGRGGMGEVYKAYDPTLHRTVALKTVRPGIESPQYLDRLYREAQACARLTHPHIVTVFEAGEINGSVYIAMEYVTGENLATILQRGTLPFDERLQIILQMLDALQAAHESGVIHRDVKPANVIRQPTGSIKLVDFGLARTEDSEPLTATGVVMATLDYASPEQLRGAHVDHRSDIYSTGVVAYELIADRRPFVGNTDIPALIYKIVHEPAPPLNEYLRTTFPALDAIVCRSMAKSADDRYLSAIAMHEALKTFVHDSREQIAAIQLAQAWGSDPDARTGERQPSRFAAARTSPATLVDQGPTQPLSDASPVSAAPAGVRGAWIAGGLAVAAVALAAVFLFSSPAPLVSGSDNAASGDPILVADATHAPAVAGLAPTSSPDLAPATPAVSTPVTPGAMTSDVGNRASAPSANRQPVASLTTTSAPLSAAPPALLPGVKDLFEGASGGAAARTALRYRVILQKEDGNDVDVDPDGTTFKAGDAVRLVFDANIDGFLYIVTKGTSGNWTVLFPSPEINAGRNAIRRGEQYHVPSGDLWIGFEGKAGAEELFVFLSRQPMTQLPGFDRPVSQPATVVASSVIENLQQRFSPRDLILQKDTRPASGKASPIRSTYIVNQSEVSQAVAANITLKHGE